MANTITIDIIGDSRKLIQGVDQANKSLKGLEASAKNLQNLTVGFAAVTAATRYFQPAINFATQGWKQYAEYADIVDAAITRLGGNKAWDQLQKRLGNNTAMTLGMSKTQIAQATMQLAGVFKMAGLEGPKLVDTIDKTITRISDVASESGKSVEEVMGKFMSGLAGQSEPLRELGVFLSEARLKTTDYYKANARGKAGLDATQKSLGFLELILNDTSGAQGNFAKTIGFTGNQLKIQEANLSDLRVEIGGLIDKAFNPLLNVINNELIPGFLKLPDPIKFFIAALAGVVFVTPGLILLGVAVKALIPLVAALFAAIGIGVGTFALIIVGIAALIAAGLLIVKNWDTIKEKAGELWEKVKEKLEPLVNFVKEAFTLMWKAVLPFLKIMGGIAAILFTVFVQPVINMFKTVAGWISKAFNSKPMQEFLTKAKKFITDLVKTFSDIKEKFIRTGINIVKGIWEGIASMGEWLKDRFFKFFGKLMPSWAKKALGEKSPSKLFMGIGDNIVKGLAIGMDPAGIKKASTGLAMGTTAGFRPAQLAAPGGMRGGIVVNINAGLGTDAYELGRVVSQALDKYNGINGGR